MIRMLKRVSNRVHLDDLLEQLDQNPSHQVVIPASWGQGRTVYGGLTAALVFHRMQQVSTLSHPDEHRPIRYLNLSYIGPIRTDQLMTIEVELLRSGRSATQLSARVLQENQTCVMAQACFGLPRESVISKKNQTNLGMEMPNRADFIPPIPKVVPKFLRHMDLKLQHGRLPFMRGGDDEYKGWMRFKQAPKAFNDAHLIALIDAWPCAVLQQLKRPAAASTMNWNLEFCQSTTTPKPDQWLAYQAKTAHAADGYVLGDAEIRNAQGELLALSRQTVGVFG